MYVFLNHLWGMNPLCKKGLYVIFILEAANGNSKVGVTRFLGEPVLSILNL